MSVYVYKKKTREELEQDNRSEYQRAKKIGNVRQAVKQIMPAAYDFVDGIMTSDSEEERTPWVYSSRGTAAAQRGEYTLELNFAGSGYTEFRTMHKHLTGKNTLQEDIHDKKTRIKLDTGIRVSWYNRLFGGWLPFVKSVKEIEKVNELMGKISKKLDDVYGEKWTDPKTGKKTNIRTKSISSNIYRVNLPGPGMLDVGKYTINSLRNYGLRFAKEYLGNILKDFRDKKKKPVNINLQVVGHSRGAVAAGESQQLIAAWVRKEYPEYEQYVKYSLVQYDPVPGSDSYHNHGKIDFDQKLVDDKQGLAVRRNADASKTDNTVFYALTTDHRFAFTPQQVNGAKRIIISPTDGHSSGLDTVDESQYKKNGNKKLYKHGYTYAGDGQLYRGSGINDLPEGVFIADENNTLVKIENQEQLNTILDNVLRTATKQQDRVDIIKKCTGTWFERHSPEKLAEKKKTVKEIDAVMDRLLPKDPVNGHVVTVRYRNDDRKLLARFVALKILRDNEKTMNPEDLKKSLGQKKLQDSVDKIMESHAFDFMCRKYDGKMLNADLFALQYQSVTMKSIDTDLINAEIKAQSRINRKPEELSPAEEASLFRKTF